MDHVVAYSKSLVGSIRAYSSPLLDSYGVVNAFPDRHGGVSTGVYASLNISTSTGDSPACVAENTRLLLSSFGASPSSAVKTHQVHAARILSVSKADAGSGILRPISDCDGLMTNDPSLTLLAASADCPLVLLYAPDLNAVSVVHAGWRGTAMDIAGKAVSMLVSHGADPGNLAAFLPPSIGSCCFETDADVPTALRQCFGPEIDRYIRKIGSLRSRVDLQGVNAYALARRGVAPSRIQVAPVCTCCHPDFFSHRRSKTQRGLSSALIRITK